MRKQAMEVWKEPSAPGDPVTGLLDGLADFKDRSRLDNIRLSTTVAINAVLEGKAATVAYVTTQGHRATLAGRAGVGRDPVRPPRPVRTGKRWHDGRTIAEEGVVLPFLSLAVSTP